MLMPGAKLKLNSAGISYRDRAIAKKFVVLNVELPAI